MAAFTRVNGAAAAVVGVLTATAQHKSYIVTVKDDSNTAIDLTLDDGVVQGKLESFLKEVSPVMYFAADASTGVVHIITDGHHNDAASLLKRVRMIFGATDTQGAANDSTVTLGTAITVA